MYYNIYICNKKWVANLPFDHVLNRIDAKGDVLAIESKQVIEMKEGNTIAPYNFRRVSLILGVIKTIYSQTVISLYYLY